jgi:large subunit ribosomal protein L25
MAQLSIAMAAETRIPGTKNIARRLRASGRVPAVLYGEQKDALPISLDPKLLLAVVHSEGGHNRILNLTISGGETTSAVLQDWLVDPVSDKLLHVDLKRIDLAKKLRVKVAVHGVGEAPGVKVQGGILEFVVREVDVECLPLDIPDLINVDVSELVIGKNIRVRDLVVDSKVTVLTPQDQLVAHIVVMKEEEVKAPEEVAVAGAVPAEPEVIKKGKKEEEGEEGAAPAKPEGKADKKK